MLVRMAGPGQAECTLFCLYLAHPAPAPLAWESLSAFCSAPPLAALAAEQDEPGDTGKHLTCGGDTLGMPRIGKARQAKGIWTRAALPEHSPLAEG